MSKKKKNLESVETWYAVLYKSFYDTKTKRHLSEEEYGHYTIASLLSEKSTEETENSVTIESVLDNMSAIEGIVFVGSLCKEEVKLFFEGKNRMLNSGNQAITLFSENTRKSMLPKDRLVFELLLERQEENPIAALDSCVNIANVARKIYDEESGRDIINRFDETKGRWVSQNEFMQQTGYKISSLRRYRVNLQWSKIKPNIAMDKQGHFIRKVSSKSNSTFEYFVEKPDL